jgi:hypothetical protein
MTFFSLIESDKIGVGIVFGTSTIHVVIQCRKDDTNPTGKYTFPTRKYTSIRLNSLLYDLYAP